MSQRQLSFIDQVIMGADKTLKTLVPGSATPGRSNPASDEQRSTMAAGQQKHIAGLMRVNHTGEVCAQALYQGQALTAKNDDVKAAMEESAAEEVDHLAWCEDRLKELGSQPSVLNPLFYAGSFAIGAAAGLAGDRVSLGFVAATEDQVCQHLEDHLEQLPEDDHKSRAILEKMLEDEKEHGSKAMDAGGMAFNPLMKTVMTGISKLMTKTTYRV